MNLTRAQIVKAEEMIGVLIREGRGLYYVTTRTGETRESDTWYEMVEYLQRNLYLTPGE